MNALEINAAIAVLANSLACKLTNKEAALLGILLAHLGEALSTIAALQELCESDDSAKTSELEAADTAQDGASATDFPATLSKLL